MTKLEFSKSQHLYLTLILSLAFKDQTSDVLKDEAHKLAEIHHELMATNPAYKTLFERLSLVGASKTDCPLSQKFYKATMSGNRFMSNVYDALLTIQSVYRHLAVSSLQKKLWQNACAHRGMSPK